MSALLKPMSLDDFLDWEARQEGRYEYDGVAARARTGGTFAHAAIQSRLVRALGNRLEGKPCQAVGSELKVRTATSARYPDALIVCSRPSPSATFTAEPVVVFEILSKSSAWLDLGQKNAEYQSIPSLRAYVVLSQSARSAQVFRRNADESWTYEFLADEAVLDLPESEIALPLGEIYQGVELAE